MGWGGAAKKKLSRLVSVLVRRSWKNPDRSGPPTPNVAFECHKGKKRQTGFAVVEGTIGGGFESESSSLLSGSLTRIGRWEEITGVAHRRGKLMNLVKKGLRDKGTTLEGNI